MLINKKALIESMEMASEALGGVESPIDNQCFHFYDSVLQAYNGTMTVEVWTSPVNLNLKFSVPGSPLLSLLKTLNVDEIDLELENNSLKVSAGNVKCKFVTTPITEPLCAVKDHLVNVSGNLFKQIIDGLDMCRHVVSRDKTAGPICGINIDNDIIISSDKCRILKFDLGVNCNINCVVPVDFVNVVSKYKDKISGIGFTKDKYLTVLSDNAMITTALIINKYPDLDQYFPGNEGKYCVIDFSGNIKESVDRWIKFLSGVDRADKEVLISISGDKCRITAVDPTLGDLEEEVKLSKAIDVKVEFYVNPTLLRDMTSRCNSFKYYIDSRLVLFEGEGFKCLIQTRR